MNNLTKPEKCLQDNWHTTLHSNNVVIPFRKLTFKSYSKNKIFLPIDIDIKDIEPGNNLYSFTIYPF